MVRLRSLFLTSFLSACETTRAPRPTHVTLPRLLLVTSNYPQLKLFHSFSMGGSLPPHVYQRQERLLCQGPPRMGSR
ncbi:uncharacterized protein J3D65DRAFT_624548 [Phyllosticta citribraziliensis]|uniref:Secreted protein n=1 Tax=Phyllosticta citribraziliensis TaxID=989973 RepID=A0ABR1LPN3_9PEZI